MEDLIMLVDNEPRVSSYDIALGFKRKHQSVRMLIEEHKEALLRQDNKHSPAVLIIKTLKRTTAGRPVETVMLNERQTMLLATHFRSTPIVSEFKEKLIDEFFRMKEYIQRGRIERLAGIVARRSLTDEIKNSGENERMHGHGYSNYTRLVCNIAGVPTGDRDGKTPEELKRLNDVETYVQILLSNGMTYKQIKEMANMTFKKIFPEPIKQIGNK